MAAVLWHHACLVGSGHTPMTASMSSCPKKPPSIHLRAGLGAGLLSHHLFGMP